MYSDEVIHQRVISHFMVSQRFLESYNEFHKTSCFVDPLRFLCVIRSTYDDIARYKAYHLEQPVIQKSHAVKRAAFLAKWLLRFHPVLSEGSTSFSDTDPHILSTPEVFANHQLAYYLAMVSISDAVGYDVRLSDERNGDLLYDFAFRFVTADGLMLFLQAIVDIVERAELVRGYRSEQVTAEQVTAL